MTNIRIFSLVLAPLLMFPLSHVSLSAPQEGPDQTVEDKNIVVTSFEEMGYPPTARRGLEEGMVVVSVKLDESGKVVSASAVSGYDLLIRNALVNARKWRFRPNKSKTAVIIYEFQLDKGRCGDTRGELFVFREPNIASVIACVIPWHGDGE